MAIACGACGNSPAGEVDAGDDGDAAMCTGNQCLTDITAMFTTTQKLDLAYYGVIFDTKNLRVEAYSRATRDCPTSTSPTPDYTLIVNEVRPMQMSSPQATANILDFKGDLLGGPLGLAATSVMVMRIAYQKDGPIELEVMLEFSSGTVMGHIYATHCDSLDA